MALAFISGSTDEVRVAGHNSYTGQAEVTIIIWAKKNANTAFRRLWSNNNLKQMEMQNGNADDLSFVVIRDGTNAVAQTDEDFELGIWLFLACTYDEADGPRVFHGRPYVAPVEANYVTRQVGTEPTTSDAGGDLTVGRRPGTSSAWAGKIASFQWFNKRLLLPEIISQWRKPHRTPELRIFHIYDKSISVQRDLSGYGNYGSVTGPVPSEHKLLEPRLGLQQVKTYGSRFLELNIATPPVSPAVYEQLSYRFRADDSPL